MNERIKELALQAWQRTNEQVSSQKSHMPDTVISQDDISDIFEEKFAQLIIEECVGVIEDMADPEEDSERYVWAIQNASAKLREHFGVER